MDSEAWCLVMTLLQRSLIASKDKDYIIGWYASVNCASSSIDDRNELS